MNSSAYGFVFARGGSKGLPGKNLALLDGVPLVGHSIQTALQSEYINDVIISTEDNRIANVARTFGGRVPFMRPAELASDTSAEWLSWQHAIRAMQELGETFDTFVSVPTTSPLRTVGDIDRCIEMLNNNRDETDIVITVCEAHRSPWFNMVTLSEDSGADLVMTGENRVFRRQDAPTVYDMTTVCYAARPEFILDANGLFDGRIKAVVVESENAVDIDTESDFRLAEYLMLKRKQKQIRQAG